MRFDTGLDGWFRSTHNIVRLGLEKQIFKPEVFVFHVALRHYIIHEDVQIECISTEIKHLISLFILLWPLSDRATKADRKVDYNIPGYSIVGTEIE